METEMMLIFIPICKRRYFENDYFLIFLISNVIYNYFDTFCAKKLHAENCLFAFYLDFPPYYQNTEGIKISKCQTLLGPFFAQSNFYKF